MTPSFRIARIAGIDIGVHYSWFFIFILVAWSVAEGFFPRFFPDWTEAQYWVTGVLASLLLFASVLVHELAHSLVAIRRGIEVNSITLFIIGGVSNLSGRSEKASTEFLVAIVGPVSSALIGLVCLALWAVLGPDELPDSRPAIGILLYLGNVNLLLAVFNLVPGFPLDGGRVLRSIVWGVTKSEKRATDVAAWSGQIIGWGMIIFGLFMFLDGELLGGLWLAFIGWFLLGAANSGRLEYEMSSLLGDVPVSQVMEPVADTVTPDTAVPELLWTHLVQRGKRAVPVLDGGQLAGIVSITDVHRAEKDGQQPGLKVGDIMTRPPLATIPPDATVEEALKVIVESDVNQLLVLRDTEIAGMISREGIMRYFQALRSQRSR